MIENTNRHSLAAMLAVTALLAAPLSAQVPAEPADLVRINESTMNDLVSAMLPLPLSGTTPIEQEFCLIWCKTITVCDGRWRADVDEMTLDIRPEGILVSGSASGTYACFGGINFDTEIDASMGQVRYEASDNSLRLVVPASIEPCFDTPLGEVCANRRPININIPTVYLRMAKLSFETPAGRNYIALTASNINVATVDNQDGDDYLELEGDVSVW